MRTKIEAFELLDKVTKIVADYVAGGRITTSFLPQNQVVFKVTFDVLEKSDPKRYKGLIFRLCRINPFLTMYLKDGKCQISYQFGYE